jgi:hypothetical protein
MTLKFTFNKKILMTIITIIGASMSYGIPTTLVQLEIFGIIVAGVAIPYIPKDIFFPSKSPDGKLYWSDYLSGAFVAISSALSSWGASAFTSTAIDWKAFITLIGTTTGGYLFKTFNSQP